MSCTYNFSITKYPHDSIYLNPIKPYVILNTCYVATLIEGFFCNKYCNCVALYTVYSMLRTSIQYHKYSCSIYLELVWDSITLTIPCRFDIVITQYASQPQHMWWDAVAEKWDAVAMTWNAGMLWLRSGMLWLRMGMAEAAKMLYWGDYYFLWYKRDAQLGAPFFGLIWKKENLFCPIF